MLVKQIDGKKKQSSKICSVLILQKILSKKFGPPKKIIG